MLPAIRLPKKIGCGISHVSFRSRPKCLTRNSLLRLQVICFTRMDFCLDEFQYSSSDLITLAGTPAATQVEDMFLVTTAPAAMKFR